jgi:NAD+ diphosphatase
MTASDDTVSPAFAASHIDRAAEERADPQLLTRLRADAATRVLVVSGDAAPLADGDALHFVTPGDVADDAAWVFLGRDESGVALLAAAVPRGDAEPFAAPAGWRSLRTVGGDLPRREADLFVAALSAGRWLLDSPYCPACGALTAVTQSGWARRCPSCGREHFPRTDPAVIVAVASARGDRLLLGSNALWERTRYSCFAGFAEAGESLESAVVREVAEEAGVAVRGIRYLGSQAWPYPRSLMIGFVATAADDDAARPDGDEIADVRWFDRDEIGAALEGRGDIVLPGRASIASRLIRQWYEESA